MSQKLGVIESLRYRFRRRKKIRAKARRRRRLERAGYTVQGNVEVRVVDRATGKEIRRMNVMNDITDIPLMIDLIHGTSADHLDVNSNVVIRNTGGTIVKTVTSMSSAPPAASGGQVTLSWSDESTDVYDPDDIYLETGPSSTEVAEALNVTWTSKTAAENWYFTWTLTIQSLLDTQFDTDGFDGMLDCITGRSSQHWDGTEGSNNMQVRVYDGNPGSQEFTEIMIVPSTQPTPSSIQWSFTRAAGASHTWARVEVWNNAQGVRLYDDDIIDRAQGASDTFNYSLTFNLAAA